jgi:hypothetical protein
MTWVWVAAGFLVVNFATVFLPDTMNFDSAMRWAGIGLLAAWYISEAQGQIKYVRESLHDDYVKRGWGKPLAIGFAATALYVAAVFAAACILYLLDPSMLEDDLGH